MKKRFWIALCLCLGMAAVSVCVGRYAIPLPDVVSILLGRAPEGTAQALLWNIRLPRVVLVALSGGALALAGMVLQTVFSNPLVSPDVLGVTSGCSVGAVFAMLFLPAFPLVRQVSAFVCGVGAVAFALWLSRFTGRSRVLGMVLAGIVVGGLSDAVLMIFKYCADPMHQLPAIEYWLMGGFQNAVWGDAATVAVLIAPSALLLYLSRFRLKVLSLGDQEALALGVRPQGVRLLAVGASTVLVAAVVSVAGVVSWVGLIAPHLVRLWGGRDVTRSMGSVFFVGGALLLWADLLARSLTSAEIPVSIFTSLVGAVLLAALLIRLRPGERRGASW